MSTIYTCYRQLHPPTGVDHAVFAHLNAKDAIDLVVAKGSLLELYAVRGAHGDAAACFLELVGVFPLASRIETLDTVPGGSTEDAEADSTMRGMDIAASADAADGMEWRPDMIAISFEGAKLVLLAYDPAVGRFTTLSIHNFSPDAIGPGAGAVETGYGFAGALREQPSPMTAADPRGRCLAMVVAGNQLVLLPTLRSRGPAAFVSREGRDHILRYGGGSKDLIGNGAAAATAGNGFVSQSAAAAADAAATTAETPASPGTAASAADGAALGTAAKAAAAPSWSAAAAAAAADDPWTEDRGAARPSWVRPVAARPFSVDLEEVGVIGDVRSIAFLRGFSEPALAVLYEAAHSAPGFLAASRHTCRLALLSLDAAQGRAAVVWSVDRLPHDAISLLAVPMPLGGVQVICVNAVLHVSRGEVRAGLAANGYAGITVDTAVHPLRANEGDWGWASSAAAGKRADEAVDLTVDVSVELDGCRATFLAPDCMLLGLRRGELYALRLHLDGDGTAVASMSLRPLDNASPPAVLVAAPGAAVAPAATAPREAAAVEAAAGARGVPRSANSSPCFSPSGLLFVGSRLADSQLLRYEVLTHQPQEKDNERWASVAAAATTAASAASRDAAAASLGGMTVAKAEGVDAEAAAAATAGNSPAVNATDAAEAVDAEAASAAAALEARKLAAADVAGQKEGAEAGGAGGASPATLPLQDGPFASATTDSAATAAVAAAAPAEAAPAAAALWSAGEKPELADALTLAGVDDEEPAAQALIPESRGDMLLDGDKAGGGSSGDVANGAAKRPAADGGSAGPLNGVRAKRRRAERWGDAETLRSEGPVAANESTDAVIDDYDSDEEYTLLFGDGAAHRDVDKRLAAAADASKPEEEQTKPVAAGPLPRFGGGKQLVDAVGYRLEVLDSLVALGPISSADVGPVQLGHGTAHDSGIVDGTSGGGTVAAGAAAADAAASSELKGGDVVVKREASKPAIGSGGYDAVSPKEATNGDAMAVVKQEPDEVGSAGAAAVAESATTSSSSSSKRKRKAADPGAKESPTASADLPTPAEASVAETAAAAVAVPAPAAAAGMMAPAAPTVPKLMCTAGYGRHGVLTLFSPGLSTCVITELKVPGAASVWSIQGAKALVQLVKAAEAAGEDTETAAGAGGGGGGGGGSMSVVILSSAPRTAAAAEGKAEIDEGGGDGGAEWTRVLATAGGTAIAEVAADDERNPFVCEAATLAVGEIAAGSLAQVHSQGVRLVRGGIAVQDVMAADEAEFGGLGLSEGLTLARASVAGHYVAVLLSDGTMRLLALEDDSDGGGGSGGGGRNVEVDLLPSTATFSSSSLAAAAAAANGSDAGGAGPAVQAFSLFSLREGESEDQQERKSGDGEGEQRKGGLFAPPGRGDALYAAAAAAAARAAADAAGCDSEEEEWAALYGTKYKGAYQFDVDDVDDVPRAGEGSSALAARPVSAGLANGHDHSDSAFAFANGEANGATALNGSMPVGAWNGGGSNSGSRGVSGKNGRTRGWSSKGKQRAVLGSTGSAVHGVYDDSMQEEEDEDDSHLTAAPPTAAAAASGAGVAAAAAAAASSDNRNVYNGYYCNNYGRGADPGWWSRSWGDCSAAATAYCVLCRSGGALEVHRLRGRGTDAETELVFLCREAAFGPPTLWNDGRGSSNSIGSRSSAVDAGASSPSQGTASGSNSGGSGGGPAAPAIADVLLWPVGPIAADAPAGTQRLALAMHTVAGDLLVYEARMSAAGAVEQKDRVDCFTRVSHDIITRPLKAAAAGGNSSGSSRDLGAAAAATAAPAGRRHSLSGMALMAGQRALAFFAPGSRAALLLAERGAVCVTPLAADDVAAVGPGVDLSRSSSSSFKGMLALAAFHDADACSEGGFVAVAPGGIVRFVSGAPMASQLLNAGVAGGGGLGGGGQGHFVAQKVPVGATVYATALVTAPEPGPYAGVGSRSHAAAARGSGAGMGRPSGLARSRSGRSNKSGGRLTILESLLRTPTYVLITSRIVDALTEPPDAAEAVAAAAAAAAAEEAAAAAALDGEQDEEMFGGPGGEDRRARRQDFCHADPRFGGAPPLLVERFQLRLVSVSEGGGARELSVYELQRDERGVEVACLELAERKGDDSPLKAFVAAGTVFHTEFGEDAVPKGRLVLYEVDYAHIATADGNHAYLPKLRQVCDREERGPVSAIRQLGRHILIAAGARVVVLHWNALAMSLVPIGFFEATTQVVSLAVVESQRHTFMAVGDLQQSVQLLVWRDEDHQLKLVAKDYDDNYDVAAAESYSTGLLVNVPALGAVVTDRRRNIKVLQYLPAAVESRGGNQLLCQADFNLGAQVVAAAVASRPAPPNRLGRRRSSLLLGTLDGGLGMLLPIDERVFRRLYALQGIMANALEHTAGTNPRQSRLFATPGFRPTLRKGMLDGTVLWRFPGLDTRVQRELTRAIGTSVDTVLDNLLEIDLAAAVALASEEEEEEPEPTPPPPPQRAMPLSRREQPPPPQQMRRVGGGRFGDLGPRDRRGGSRGFRPGPPGPGAYGPGASVGPPGWNRGSRF